MMFRALPNKHEKNFVRPFYLKPHVACLGSSAVANCPPGFVSPFNPRNRIEFYEGQIARKYTDWDAMYDSYLKFDATQTRVLNQNNVYVVDPTENY